MPIEEQDDTLANKIGRPSNAPPADLGEVIGGYRLDRVLGEGGMGCVYAGTHSRLGRKAAVKVLATKLTADRSLISRFFHEAKIVNEVRHPNIVDIFDFVETKDPVRVACVMEYIDGPPLNVLLKTQALTLKQTANAGLQLASALAAVHAVGVVHRDLKPQNIMVTGNPSSDMAHVPSVKVLDFGIAKVEDKSSVSHRTATGSVMGTPAYMAPEQIAADHITTAADVYALGEILFEMATGKRMFTGSGVEIFKAKLLDTTVDLTPLAAIEGSSRLLGLVRRCVGNKAAQRPTIVEVKAELENILGEIVEDEHTQAGLAGPAGLPQTPTQLAGFQSSSYDLTGLAAGPAPAPRAKSQSSTVLGPPAVDGAGPVRAVAVPTVGRGASAPGGRAVEPPPPPAVTVAAPPPPPPAAAPAPARALSDAALRTPVALETQSQALPPPARKGIAPRRLLTGVVVLIAGAAAAFVAVKQTGRSDGPPLVVAADEIPDNPFAAVAADAWKTELGDPAGTVEELLTTARTRHLEDTWAGYEAADKALRSALVKSPADPVALARYVENALLWKWDRLTEDEIERLRAAARFAEGTAPTRSDGLRALTLLSLFDGDLVRAKKLIDQALSREPGDSLARLIFASTFLSGDVSEAITAAEAALKDLPQLRRRDRVLARAHANAGKFSAAFRTLTARLKTDADNVAVHRLYGDLERELGRTKNALSRYTAAITGRGDTRGAELDLGMLQLEIADFEGAFVTFQRVSEDNTSPVHYRTRALVGAARAQLGQGSWRTATTLTDQALALSPKDPAALLARAEAAVEGGDLATATEMLKRLQEVRRNTNEANVIRGRIAMSQGKGDEAVKHFEEAILGDPRQMALRIVLAGMYMKFSGFNQAFNTIRQAAKFDPMERMDTREKLFFSAPRSAVTQAIEHFNAASKEIEDPALKAEFHAVLGFIYYHIDDVAKAKEQIGFALRGTRSNTLALLYEGQLLLDAGQIAKAEKSGEELLKLERNSAAAHLLMARILAKKNKVLEAKSEYEAALRFDPELFLAAFEKDALGLKKPESKDAVLAILSVQLRKQPNLIVPKQIMLEAGY